MQLEPPVKREPYRAPPRTFEPVDADEPVDESAPGEPADAPPLERLEEPPAVPLSGVLIEPPPVVESVSPPPDDVKPPSPPDTIEEDSDGFGAGISEQAPPG
jgi:hypothetical protein